MYKRKKGNGSSDESVQSDAHPFTSVTPPDNPVSIGKGTNFSSNEQEIPSDNSIPPSIESIAVARAALAPSTASTLDRLMSEGAPEGQIEDVMNGLGAEEAAAAQAYISGRQQLFSAISAAADENGQITVATYEGRSVIVRNQDAATGMAVLSDGRSVSIDDLENPATITTTEAINAISQQIEAGGNQTGTSGHNGHNGHNGQETGQNSRETGGHEDPPQNQTNQRAGMNPAPTETGGQENDSMPMLKNGEPDFGKATPERAYAYIYNNEESGLSSQEADDLVKVKQKNAQKRLEAARKAKAPKFGDRHIGDSIARLKAAQQKHRDAIASAQAEVEYWQRVKQIADEAHAERAVKMGKLVDDRTYARIADIVNGFDTLGEFYSDDRATAAVVGELNSIGVINDKNMPELFNGNRLSERGKELVESVLIGKAFEGHPETVRQLLEFPAMRQKVVVALKAINDNVTRCGQYSLMDELADAINLVSEARRSGYTAQDTPSELSRQQNLFPDEMGQTVADWRNLTVLMLSEVMNDGRTTQLKKVLNAYNAQAVTAASGQVDVWAQRPRKKEEILTDIINTYGTDKQKDALERARQFKRAGLTANETNTGDADGNSTGQSGDAGGSDKSPTHAPANEQGGGTDTENSSGRQQGDLAQGEGGISLSQEKDEKGSPFVVSKNGTIDFGTIDKSQAKGISTNVAAPIRLSYGNQDYGYVHMQKHIDQLKQNGYNSVEEFAEAVASGKNEIRQGNVYTDETTGEVKETYLLVMKGKKGSVLYVELVPSGNYYTINSGGVFKNSYIEKRKELWSASTEHSATSGEPQDFPSAQNKPESDDVSALSQSPSEGKGTNNSSFLKETREKVNDLSSLLQEIDSAEKEADNLMRSKKRTEAEEAFGRKYAIGQEVRESIVNMSDEELATAIQICKDEDGRSDLLSLLTKDSDYRQSLHQKFDKGKAAQPAITPTNPGKKTATPVDAVLTGEEGKLRPRLSGVYHEGGFIVGSDGRLLLVEKAKYPESQEKQITDKKGNVIEDEYPDWKAVLNRQGNGSAFLADIDKLARYVAGVIRAYKAMPKKDRPIYNLVAVRTADGKINFYDAERLAKFLSFANHIGGEIRLGNQISSTIGDHRENTLYVHSNKGDALLMPDIAHDEAFAYSHFYDESNQRAEMKTPQNSRENSREGRITRRFAADPPLHSGGNEDTPKSDRFRGPREIPPLRGNPR